MGSDHARLGDDAAELTVFIDNRCYMRMEHAHCAALIIEPGGRFVCGVYASRPDVCRDLARGSTACGAELLQKRGRAQDGLRLARG